MKFLDGFGEQAYALLRIVAGLLFMAHGVQKFFNFPAAFPYPLTPVLQAAGAIELIAGALIAIGLFTRPAAFIASGMSAVGYWVAHGMQSPSRSPMAARRSRFTASFSCSSRRAGLGSGAPMARGRKPDRGS